MPNPVHDRKRYIDEAVDKATKKTPHKKAYKQSTADKMRASALKLFGQVERMK